LLFASFLLTLIIYIPNVIENYSLYKIFRIINYILFATLFFLTISKKQIVIPRVLIVYFFVLIICFTETLVFLVLNLNIKFDEIIQLSIPFFAITIGYNINISTKKYINLLIIYSLTALIPSLISIYYYIGSFTVLDVPLVSYKNEIGAIISNCIAITMCVITLKNLSKSKRLCLVLYTLILFACLLVFRARAAYAAALFSFLVLLWLFLRNKKNVHLISSTIIIILVIFYLFGTYTIPTFLHNFFLGSNDLSDLDKLSTGRIDRNLAALKFISDSPLFGQLTTSHYLEWVHNYVLLKISQYGFLGSFPLLCLYFYLIWTDVIKILKTRQFSTNHFGYIVLIIPFFISLFEPSFPYGPGSVQVIVFFMLGYSLKNSVNKTSSLVHN